MSNVILPKSKFIHIPKCGGTAILSVLCGIGCIKDKSQVFHEPHFGHLFLSQMPQDERINFTFVRNPITWWHSWYWWNKTQPLSRFNGQELKTKSFDQWVDEYGQFWLGLYTILVKRYMGEDINFPCNNKVTKVGKTEHLFKDLKRIFDETGEQYDSEALDEYITYKTLLPKNQSNIQMYSRKDVSDATKNIIYKTEKEIFTKFQYGTDV